MIGGVLPTTFDTDGNVINDWELYGETASLKSTSYDTAYTGRTLNITNGSLASDGSAAVTPYYDIPREVGLFAVRFDASGVSSWDYINMCVYQYPGSGSNYSFMKHVYPIKTYTSSNGYITKIFYFPYAVNNKNRIVCRFVIPIGIINNPDKFDIYTGIGTTSKVELTPIYRSDINADAVQFVAVGELNQNHQLYFHSRVPMRAWMSYGYWDGTTYSRITESQYMTADDPYELVFPAGANAARGTFEDGNTYNNPINVTDIANITIIKKNDPKFTIPLTIADEPMDTVRTNNLFDYTTMDVSDANSYLKSDGSVNSSNDWNISDYIPCDNDDITISYIGGATPAICLYDENKQFIIGKAYGTVGVNVKLPITITGQGAKFVRFSWYKVNGMNYDDLSKIMVNEGTSTLPYEPYGYKQVVPSGANTHEYEITVNRPLRSDDKLVYAYSNSKRIDGDGSEESITLPVITSFNTESTLSTTLDLAPTFYVIAVTGAFRNAHNLAYINIPESVKTIGANAFQYTALTKVKIASDCTYSATSFPDGCQIEFY